MTVGNLFRPALIVPSVALFVWTHRLDADSLDHVACVDENLPRERIVRFFAVKCPVANGANAMSFLAAPLVQNSCTGT